MPLRLKLKNCTGCQLCQLACSAVHEKAFNPQKARIKLIHEYTDEGIRIASRHCIFCKKCEEACPVGAISNNGRWMIVDHKICIGCGDCVRTCPKDVIYLDRERKSIICDLCGGSPKCVEWCPKQVISCKGEAAS
ncbi:MAG: 4Fe-4S dicluster domain-containing protein [Spirochaetaceae bacterium]|nr:MAG: 4Fe-4S dicluster domain-containing protein [Spirochaetaceae bacterium]